MTLFEQPGPRLSNTYTADPYLAALLTQYAPHHFTSWQVDLGRMGEVSAFVLYPLQQADRLNEPILTQWSPWGERIDEITLTPLWIKAEKIAVEEGLVALACPEGNTEVIYIEPRDSQGKLQQIVVNRLKDKLGTRKVPTAELLLSGVPLCFMRRGLQLAWDYAAQRQVFGEMLIRKPLYRETLLQQEAVFCGALCFTFACAHLLGKRENQTATAQEEQQLRLFIPLLKLITGKQVVSVLSEVMESFGGAGYIEDTGIPQLLRDAHVLPIWEGTTNVLSLDALHVLFKFGEWEPASWLSPAHLQADDLGNVQGRLQIQNALKKIKALQQQPNTLEANARNIAIAFAQGLELLYLADFAVHTPALTFASDTPHAFTINTQDLLTRFL